MSRRRAAIVGTALGLAAAAGAATLAFRAGRESATGGRAAGEAPPRPSYETIDPAAPPWSPTARYALPSVGSVFRDHLARAASPLDGVEAVLFSPRDEECLDDCPLALRYVGGARGAVMARRLATSLWPELRVLARAPGVPPDLAAFLLRGGEEVARRAGAAGGPGVGAVPAGPSRALFMAMPRPDLGEATWSVGLALGDLPDPHFDAIATAAGDRDAWALLLSRVEEGEGADARVSGVAAFAHATGKASWRPIPESAREVGAALGSVLGHFGALPQDVAGLLLGPDGTVSAFGNDLRPRPLRDDVRLRRALLAAIRRV